VSTFEDEETLSPDEEGAANDDNPLGFVDAGNVAADDEPESDDS
jgi:hypothetical protein